MAHNPNPKIREANEGLVAHDRLGPYRSAWPGYDVGPLNWTGKVRCLPDRLDWPLHWKTPKRILVPTLGDLFHEDVDWQFVGAVWEYMARARQHRFLVLTKRVDRMATVLESIRRAAETWSALRAHLWPLPHVYLGVTVCNQEEADAKLPVLLSIPAAGHWVSVEPMLGPVDLKQVPVETGWGLGWVVAGAETGPSARPAKADWFRSLRDQCSAAGIPFFLKQVDARRNRHLDGVEHREIPEALNVSFTGAVKDVS